MASGAGNLAYLDCRFGVAGDMLLAALIDAGCPRDELEAGLRSIRGLEEEWALETKRVVRSKGSIAALHLTVTSVYDDVEIPVTAAAHSHGGDGHSQSHTQSHDHDHHHHHDHSHTFPHDHTHDDENGGDDEGAGHHFHGPHRNLETIRAMIQTAEGLPERVKKTSIEVFTALAKAEAQTHGVGIEQIHFHEVGAVDSIVDTVGVVLALHLLGVDEVYCSRLPFGEGMTRMTAHGVLPVPPPATLRLMLGIPTAPAPPGATGELVTPTGAALLKILAAGRFVQPPPFVPEMLGVGAGTKDFPDHANVVRVVIGRREGVEGSESILPVPLNMQLSNPAELGLAPPADNRLTDHVAETRLQHSPRSPNLAPVSPALPPSHPVHPQLPGHPPRPSLPDANPMYLSTPLPSFLSHMGQGPMPTVINDGGDWEERRLCELEANLDDMSPETAAFALERLLEEEGCLDVWYSPAVMKKGRPGLTLHVLCEPGAAAIILRRVFLETPTLGVRAKTVARLALRREFVVVPTRYGDVRAKIGRLDGQIVNVKPEYEDCRMTALTRGVPLRQVVEEATRVATGQVTGETDDSAAGADAGASSAVGGGGGTGGGSSKAADATAGSPTPPDDANKEKKA